MIRRHVQKGSFSVGIICVLGAFLAAPSAGTARGKAENRWSTPAWSAWGKWRSRTQVIHKDLEVRGTGLFEGELSLVDPVTGLAFVLDPATGELVFEFDGGSEGLWFEPGFTALTGGLSLGDSDEAIPGLIRWTGTDFEGFDGIGWVSLTRDTSFSTSPAADIGATDIASWQAAAGWGDHHDAGYLRSFTESDPVFGASPAARITAAERANWSAAYTWGDHAQAGYLKGFVESDPLFAAAPAASIAAADIAAWNTTASWGDHRDAGYLLGFTETDPALQLSTAGALAQWDGAALVDAPIAVAEEGIALNGNTTIAGDLEITGALRLPPQGDIPMGVFGPGEPE